MVKQVIVIRNDLRNSKGEKVRTGKIAAQVAHASMSWLVKRISPHYDGGDYFINAGINEYDLSKAELEWMGGLFTKICLQVDSEHDLMSIYEAAKEAKLEVHLIEDAGLTEFNGVKTKTCLAIGPDYSENIDPITKNLKLY